MQTDYRHILLDEYKKRTGKNPQYSMRAFARDLSLTPSRLSEALNRKCGISPKKANILADILGFSQIEKDHFVTLVEAEHGRSRVVRHQASETLEKRKQDVPEKTIKMEWLNYFSSWYHSAILELVQLDDFKPLPIWISRRLGISVVEARDAIDRLLYLGLLKMQEGNLIREEGFYSTPTDIPSAELRQFHREMLQKAEAALTFNSVEERDLSSLVFPIDEKNIKAAKEALRKFSRKFCKDLMSSSNQKNRVYALTMQFFPLDIGGQS